MNYNILYIAILIAIIVYAIFANRVYIENMENNQIKKIAIITAIYGNYDNIKEQNINNKADVDWYCFTDNTDMKSDQWTIITTPYHLNSTKYEYKNSYHNVSDKKIYNMMSAKYYKLKNHEIDILQKYDYIIWIDGSITLRPNFINNVLKNIIDNDYELASFKHSERNNINDEVKLSLTMDKYKTQDLKTQYQDYLQDGFNDKIGLFENTIIIRKKTERINNIFDMWWIHNLRYSYQDQISFPYVLWKLNENPDYIIQENIFNSIICCEAYDKYNYKLIETKTKTAIVKGFAKIE